MLERGHGRVELGFRRRGAATVLARLYQAGAGKALLPRPADPAHAEAVLITLSGGLTDGDRLEWRARWQAGAAATVSGQAAEKIYRARGLGEAVIDTRLDVGPGALALWLPQETILFERARLVRRNRLEVAKGGRLLAVEATVLGRRAMGEAVTLGLLDEGLEVRHAGRLVLAERQRLRGRIASLVAQPAIAHGAEGFVTLLHVGEGAGRHVAALRDAIGGHAAIGAPDPDLVLARWPVREAHALRPGLEAALGAFLRVLGLPEALPRVWRC